MGYIHMHAVPAKADHHVRAAPATTCMHFRLLHAYGACQGQPTSANADVGLLCRIRVRKDSCNLSVMVFAEIG